MPRIPTLLMVLFASLLAPLPAAAEPFQQAASEGSPPPAAAPEDAPGSPAADAAAPEDETAAQADVPDDPALSREMDEAAREMDELREAERAVVEEGARRFSEILEEHQRGAAGSVLHQRLGDAMDPGRPLPLVPDPAELEAAALAEVGSFDIEKARSLYDIPVEMQPLVAEYIRFFQTSGRKHFVKWMGRSTRYLPMMRQTLREAGLPEDTVFLSMIESGFSSMALSWAKAAGLWQFIEPTGKRFGLRVDFWVDQRRDPAKSTVAAAGYLKELYGEFGDWRLAWAGYNAGGGKVRKAIKAEGTTDFWQMVHGRTFRPETKHYVPKLMAAALIYKNLKAFGFSESEFEPQPPLEYDEADVPEATDLEVIARAAGVTLDEVKDLNPELRRWCTPPARAQGESYRIKLPRGSGERFAQEFPKIAPKDRLTFRVHRVAKGDTLSKIAAKYGSAVEAIMRMNGMRDSRRLRIHADLVVPVPRGGSIEGAARQARAAGFRAAPAEQEVPAEPPVRRGASAGGTVKTSQEGGKTRVVYAVASGDSLWSIARRFDTHVDQVVAWNGLPSKRAKLRIGQELTIWPGPEAGLGSASPAQAAAAQPAKARGEKAQAKATPSARGPVHVVEPGDTLWSISRRYGVSVEELRRWNKLGKKSGLKVGKPLSVKAPGRG